MAPNNSCDPSLVNLEFFSKVGASVDALGFLLAAGGLLTTSNSRSLTQLLGSQVFPFRVSQFFVLLDYKFTPICTYFKD